MSDFITVAELRIEAERLCDENERLEAENAKLREELADAPKCETCEAMLDCDECLRADGSHKERRRLSAENAKLRELVRDVYMSRLLTENENESLWELCAGLLTGYECGYGELCKGCTWDGLGDSKTFSCLPRAKARELGVEVDG